MGQLTTETLAAYWTANELATNLVVFMNIVGALLLGLVVGYERSYHGRAAGMRTYGLVCMASAALTVIAGYPSSWFGGQGALMSSIDPTRIIQGIVTGIGFLGAGVIMKEGLSISGLTTAASIWASSAIGIMVGVGFYAAAILLALMSAACMIYISKLQTALPSRQAISVSLRFKKDFIPREDALRRMALERGYEVAGGTISIDFIQGQPEWHFVAVANKRNQSKLSDLAHELAQFDGVESFHLSHARN
ncbi:MAG: MgtC/SapB family protein [Burkholderiales bacterium]|nr:MgtC/SapB family protein [Burkholderiales bacterium]